MDKELATIGKALSNPERPFTAIIGGAKVKDKIGVIDHLLDIVDNLLSVEDWHIPLLKHKGMKLVSHY